MWKVSACIEWNQIKSSDFFRINISVWILCVLGKKDYLQCPTADQTYFSISLALENILKTDS